jgi:hypothetical protein
MACGKCALVLMFLGVAGLGQALAQEAHPTPAVEVTIIPGGWTFFTEGKDTSGPDFGSYGLGGGLTVNLSRVVAIEGEVSGALGVSQDLNFAGLTSTKPPNFLNYTGNVVFSVPTHSAVVPYVTGGMGGLSMFEKPRLGIFETETFLTGNVGGGIKWYAGRWGLRGDYRFITVRSKDDAPAFFGQETRYGHRVYGGVILNVY